MTGFADDASPALLGIEGPVVGRQTTGVDVDREAAWAGLGGQRGAQADGERGEAAVEADGEEGGGTPRDGQRGIEVGLGERERLLDPDGLAGGQRRAGELAMSSVTRGDEDRGDLPVGQHRVDVGCRGRGVTGEQLRGKAVGGDEGGRRRALAPELRHEDAGGEVAAADDDDAAGRAAVPIRARQGAEASLIRDGILDQQSVGAQATQVVVELRRGGERMPGGQQRGDVERAGSHQREDLGEVGPGGRRIGRIRGAVRTRDLERDLVRVEVSAIEREARHADQHHAAAAAAEAGGEVDRFVGGSAGRDEHAGRAAGKERRQARPAVGNDRARLGGIGALRLIRIDADDADAAGAENPDGELADEAEAHDDHRVARAGVDEPKALQRDGRERREGRMVVGDAVRDADGERRIGRDDLGVRGVGDDAVAGGEAGHLARVEHLADVAIAERNGLGELAADRGDGGEQSFRADLREHRAELLRLLTCLAQPAAAAELDEHALGAERDERTGRADEQSSATRAGGGHVEEFGATRTQMLDELAQGQERSRADSAED